MTPRRLVGLIGTNIAQSLAPALHEDAFAAAGIAGHYHLMDVSTMPGRRLVDLLDAARTVGFAGVNITHPFKEAVIPLLDAVSAEATEIGAVNTVVFDQDGRATGHNTDCSGFRQAFTEALGGDAARGQPVLLLGGGGAGRAVSVALMALGASKVRLYDQDRVRATALHADLARISHRVEVHRSEDLRKLLCSNDLLDPHKELRCEQSVARKFLILHLLKGGA